MRCSLITLVCSASALSSCLAYTPPGQRNADVNRRAFVFTSFGLVAAPTAAFAGYGDSTKMELPNYIEFLIEKNKVPGDEGTLYTGADPSVLLERLLVANTKLLEIPKLAEEKKWSQIQGVLTGPLGSLAETLNLIIKIVPKSQAACKQLKADLIAIGQAATRKDEAGCLTLTQQASKDLEAFVKVAFD